ncbi:MAG: lactate utilization protein C [Proteobacteria bacterium]|nr:MAG: lactate utilization protein C [Pseudomonadota bacterium]
MSDARSAIFKRLRRPSVEGLRMAPPTQRARPRVEKQGAGQRFVDKLKAAAATVTLVDRWSQVGEAVALYLHGAGRPLRLTRTDDPQLDAVSWPDGMQVERPRGKMNPAVALSVAFAGVVETGSLVLRSGPENPTTLNFLSDFHIVVLRAGRLVLHLEDVWPKLRKAGLGRTVNFITGPSRTADVEQTMQLGAHGPRRLHVIIVKE